MRGGQYGYRNHVLAFEQNVQSLVGALPRAPGSSRVLLVRKQGRQNTHKDFRVRRAVVLAALTWLFGL